LSDLQNYKQAVIEMLPTLIN